MEQAIIALVSLSLTLTIYLDRARRVDMAAGFARLDGRIDELRTEMHGHIDDLRTEMHAGSPPRPLPSSTSPRAWDSSRAAPRRSSPPSSRRDYRRRLAVQIDDVAQDGETRQPDGGNQS